MIRKFTRTETAPEPVSPETHKVIEDNLRKIGNTSARELSDSQRSDLRQTVEESEDNC